MGRPFWTFWTLGTVLIQSLLGKPSRAKQHKHSQPKSGQNCCTRTGKQQGTVLRQVGLLSLSHPDIISRSSLSSSQISSVTGYLDIKTYIVQEPYPRSCSCFEPDSKWLVLLKTMNTKYQPQNSRPSF